MTKNITVYTSNNCASCHMVKQYLQMKGKTYDEINVEEDPSKQKELMEYSGGQVRTPVTVITKEDGSKDVSVGYNLSSLSSAIA